MPYQTSLMTCPLTNTECKSTCAFLVESVYSKRACAIAVIASSGTAQMGFSPFNHFDEIGKDAVRNED